MKKSTAPLRNAYFCWPTSHFLGGGAGDCLENCAYCRGAVCVFFKNEHGASTKRGPFITPGLLFQKRKAAPRIQNGRKYRFPTAIPQKFRLCVLCVCLSLPACLACSAFSFGTVFCPCSLFFFFVFLNLPSALLLGFPKDKPKQSRRLPKGFPRRVQSPGGSCPIPVGFLGRLPGEIVQGPRGQWKKPDREFRRSPRTILGGLLWAVLGELPQGL